jgi:hypothetical protein
MVFTIGTTLALIATIFGMAFSAWALLLGSALIFRRKAEISHSLIKYAPGRSFFLGVVMLFIIGVISLALLAVPLPIAKVLGYSGLLVAFSLAAIGNGGLVLLVADRLRQYDTRLRPFVAMNRAALLIVSAGLVPLLGLFVIFPAVLSMGIGTAMQALFMRNEVSVASTEYIH